MDEDDAISNPHDRLFRETFAHTESLRSFVQAYAPSDIVASIDETTGMEPWPGTFVDQELSTYHSDIVCRFLIGGKPAFVYLLFEHQSTPDADMGFRLFTYLGRLWDDIDKKEPGTRPRPPILPMVLYHGQRKWNVATQFQDLIDAPDSLLPFTPSFEYVLVDLNEPGIQDQVNDLRCRFVLHLMHAAASGTLFDVLRRNGPVIRRLTRSLATGDELAFLETIIRYVVSVADIDARVLQEFVAEHVNKEAGEIVMTTTAERWMAEGAAKGRIEGEIALLRRQIEQKFPDAPPVDLEGFSLEQLEEIGRRILTCDSLDQVMKGIR